MFRAFATMVLILAGCRLLSAEQSADGLEISPGLLADQWPASWIAPPGRDGTSYGVFHFRKKITLNTKPERFVIHVSADNRYKLLVNGSQVGDGPARGDLAHWRFETFDIADRLTPGENLLAAVVWNFGEQVPFAQITWRTGFLVQGNSSLEAPVNTDSSWKVLEDAAYGPVSAGVKEMGSFTVVGPAERIDGGRYPWGWEKPVFDDSGWPNAEVVSPAVPRGVRWLRSHWQLVPRMIPPLEKSLQEAPLVRLASGVDAGRELLRSGAPLTVPPRTRATLLLDQTYLTTAYPELVLSGGKGAQVRLTYAEALVDQKGIKGNRDQIEGKHIFGYADEFIPDGGQNRLFTTLWFRTFRYLELAVETLDQPLTVESFRSRYVGYPFREQARFDGGDPLLGRIWQVGWRTARLCAGETYFDCPYYEQLNYVGDTRIQALISLYVSGDDRMMRKAITLFDDSRLPEGLTQSRYPTYMPQVIPPYSLFWIAMVYDYWMQRDDPEFAARFMPGVRGVIGWFERRLSGNGMLGELPDWNFVDWSAEFDSGVPPGADQGRSAVVNLQFVYALNLAEKLAARFGLPGESDHYRALADRITAAVKRECWDSSRGLLAETPDKKQFSQHANVMAVLVDLVPAQESRQLMERVLKEPDLIQCTYYYRFYLVRALVKAGLADRYLDLLGPWKNMLDAGLTTFAEEPDPTRSDCHAWSASPLYEFLATVCGINPAAPGFRRIRIEPQPGRLAKIICSFPHPAGDVTLDLERRGAEGIRGRVTLPAGLEGEFVWKGKPVGLHPGSQEINLP